MKPKATLRRFLAAIGCATIAVSSASAQTTRYLDSDGNIAGFGSNNVTWNTPANMWTTNILGTSNIGNTFISSLDDFNIGTAANSYSGTVTLGNSTQSIRSLTSAGSSVVTLKSGGTVRTLNLGSGGLTMNGTSSVTIGDGVAANNLLINLGAFGQTWTNNTANNLTILNTAATFSRSAGSTLTFNKVGVGNFVMSAPVLNNDATGIVGPWALFGTGTSTRYAANNAGTIAGYSGGTAAAGAENFTSSTTNYDFSTTGTTTLTANRVANTVRYTGTGNVIDLGAAGTNTLTANGILAAGASGTLTIQRTGGTGTLRAGSTGTNSELIIAGPQNINITAPISNGNGASALTYSGTGTLTLSGDNTYTGANTVNSGTLVLGSATALGTTGKALGVYGSGTLDLNGFNANVGAFNGDSGSAIVTNSAAGDVKELTVGTGNTAGNFGGVISGNLRLIKSGTNTLTLSGVNTFTGGLTVGGGTVNLSNVGGLDTAGAAGSAITVLNSSTFTSANGAITLGKSIDIAGGALLTFVNGSSSWTVTGAVTGAGGIAPQDASRTVFLTSVNNTFTGQVNFNVNGSVLNTNSIGDAPGAGAIEQTAGASGTFIWGAGATTPLVLNHRQFKISGGSGTLTISNANTASSHANIITVNTDLSVTQAAARTFALGGANTGNNLFAGGIGNGSGTVSLTKADAGKWILGGANTYTGATTISAGNLEIGGSGTLGNVSAGVGSYAGNISIANTSSGRLTYKSSASQTFSGVVSGAGALFVESGTLTLTNTNSYTGATNVNGGTLLINGSTSTSVVTVNGGAVGGTGLVGSSLSLLNGSFHVVNLLDALQVVGTVSLYAGFGVDNLTGLDWGTVSAGTYTLIDGTLGTGVFAGLDHNSLGTAYDAGFGRTAYFQEGSLQLVVNVLPFSEAIPEPSAALLGGLGALLLLRRRRA